VTDIPATYIPLSTYRLQFNRSFTFRDAEEILPYLAELGITDIYASPYLKARPGSPHGYDIVNPLELNPEVGSIESFERMTAELARLGMGQILDIVPNHMGIASPENEWWMDVLEGGPGAIHAPYFDINWEPVKRELKDRILIPVLGDQYGNVLDRGELRLVFDNGALLIRYYDQLFPLRVRTYGRLLGHGIERLEGELGAEHDDVLELKSIITSTRHLPLYTSMEPEQVEERYREKEIAKKRIRRLYRESTAVRRFIDGNVARFNGDPDRTESLDLLDRLLAEQVFRLAHWRVATEEINYRRFFDINEMAAIRAEIPRVFRETHSLVLRLVREGKATGLRVDHPDGLYNPADYFRRLQEACFVSRATGPGEPEPERKGEAVRRYREILRSAPSWLPFYVVAEKILMREETIPGDWSVFSTTGYTFSNLVNGIFVRTGNGEVFDDIYASFIGERLRFPEVVYEAKKLIMSSMASEIHTLGHYLDRISEKDRHTRDFTLNSLTMAISEVIASFPVYRTYIGPAGVSEEDRRTVDAAVAEAKRRNPTVSESIFDFLRDVLLLRESPVMSAEDRHERLDFVMKLQQVTGPFMAKGLEDTAFYIYNRLVSLNEVGGSPDQFGTPLESFHFHNGERAKNWPRALIATSTHDSKRGEDVRGRIDVLSEIPREWEAVLSRWSRLNGGKKMVVDGAAVPNRNEEYLLYQTLVGAAPLVAPSDPDFLHFRDRIRQYMLKALREAKVNTSWINPHPGYEEGVLSFVDRILDAAPENRFPDDLLLFIRRIEPYAILNSLSRTLLKITSPGIPDFYQGSELWEQTLVDPDNRRPVDYRKRITMLEELKRRERETEPAALARELAADPGNGMVKLFLIRKGLALRKSLPDLFLSGGYLPLETAGDLADNVCAFARSHRGERVVVAVPRLLAGMAEKREELRWPGIWKGTFVRMEEGYAGKWRNVFTGVVEEIPAGGPGKFAAKALFADFPAALLLREGVEEK
jgi:(1->4)-alpha-D-glucan 1-alpha-D-glucosylmutase